MASETIPTEELKQVRAAFPALAAADANPNGDGYSKWIHYLCSALSCL